jgi:hypothetical protein
MSHARNKNFAGRGKILCKLDELEKSELGLLAA